VVGRYIGPIVAVSTRCCEAPTTGGLRYLADASNTHTAWSQRARGRFQLLAPHIIPSTTTSTTTPSITHSLRPHRETRISPVSFSVFSLLFCLSISLVCLIPDGYRAPSAFLFKKLGLWVSGSLLPRPPCHQILTAPRLGSGASFHRTRKLLPHRTARALHRLIAI